VKSDLPLLLMKYHPRGSFLSMVAVCITWGEMRSYPLMLNLIRTQFDKKRSNQLLVGSFFVKLPYRNYAWHSAVPR
jgi:hypothetical protein